MHADTAFPIDKMVHIPARMIPASDKQQAKRVMHDPMYGPHTHWIEVGMAFSISPCAYGCKLYTRKQGAVTRFAIKHSSTYGHPKNTN